MFIVVMNENMKNDLLKQCPLIKTGNTVNNKNFWVFKRPEVFNYNFDKFQGEYFLTEHIRFDF